MGIESELPTILTVLVTAAIDSINPCAIGVLILMMSVILAGGGTVRRMLFLGFVYCFSVYDKRANQRFFSFNVLRREIISSYPERIVRRCI